MPLDVQATEKPANLAANQLGTADTAAGSEIHRLDSTKEKETSKDDSSIVDPTSSTDNNSEHEELSTGLAEDSPRDVEAALSLRSTAPAFSVFTTGQKRFIVFMTALAGFFSPLSASIYFPALNTLSAEFNVSPTLINLTLTTYMILQGLAPAVFGDLADSAGRRPAYIIGFVIYIAANIGLATQDSYVALLILRCLQSTGSSGTIAMGSGVVADIATNAERGVYMGWVTSGPMVAPALGPVLGGIFAQFLGWRWIFWFLTILAGAYLIPFMITFPETGRKIVGNGSIPPQGWNMSLLNYLKVKKVAKAEAQSHGISLKEYSRRAQAGLPEKPKLRWPNPLKALHVVFEKDMSMLLFFNALIYTAFYDVIGKEVLPLPRTALTVAASMPFFFQEIYGYNDLQIGLCFLPYGAGALIAPQLSGRVMDWNYARVAKSIGFAIDRKRGDDLKDFPLERARIQVAWPFLIIGNSCVLVYGWVLQQEAHLAAPLVLQFFMGIFLTGAFNVMSVMLIDLYPQSPATATAANNLVRCLMGAGGTAVIFEMIDAMGRGWCFTFIAVVVFATSPILRVLTTWGPKWREERRLRIEARVKQTSP